MTFDRQNRVAHGGSINDEQARHAPGRRSLTEELSSGPVIQRKDARDDKPEAEPTLDTRGRAINHVLESYQSIDVAVPMPEGQAWTGSRTTRANVKLPYWNNKYVKEVAGERLTPPDGFDLQARQTELRALGVGLDEPKAVGKGRPGEIAKIIADAIAADFIPKPRAVSTDSEAYWASAWRPVIEAWLLKVGIGLDCSGFVYEALLAARGANEQTSGQADADEGGILDYYTNETVGRTNASDEMLGGQTKDTLGGEVKGPAELSVADVMWIPGHIRIVMQVDRAGDVTSFVTAESTVDGRYRKDGPVNGPRIHYWRYVGDTLYERYEGSQTWDKSGEHPIFRSHLGPPTARPVIPKAGGAPTAADPNAVLAAAGTGEALTGPVRHQMERSFGVDLGSVRVHQGDAAPALGAQAFADGEHVHFAPGRYQPGTPAGDELIGHELAHVVQQREGRVAAPQGKGAAVVDDPALEAEADRMGAAAAGGRPAAAREPTATASQGHAVQRREDEGDGGAVAQAGGGFDALLAAVDRLLAAGSAPVDQLRAPVTGLVEWCRAHLPDRARVQSYLGSSVPRDAKVTMVGALGNELTRMEFMLGGLFNGVPSGKSWRANEGSGSLFPGTYLKAAGGLPGDLDWCTAFAGYGFGRLGAGAGVTDNMGSGTKQRGRGAVVFPQDSWTLLRHVIAYWEADASRRLVITSIGDLVARFMGDAPGVLDQLDPPRADDDRTLLEQYLYNVGAPSRVVSALKTREVTVSAPRVGDLLIFNTQGAAEDQDDDHTAMIDRFAFPTISTIEGNISDATATRELDLTSAAHRDQIYFISRPAQQMVDAAAAGAGGGDANAGEAELASLRDHNARMHAVFMKLSGGGASAAYDAPVHDWNK